MDDNTILILHLYHVMSMGHSGTYIFTGVLFCFFPHLIIPMLDGYIGLAKTFHVGTFKIVSVAKQLHRSLESDRPGRATWGCSSRHCFKALGAPMSKLGRDWWEIYVDLALLP